jgi:serine/threonine protein kinase
VFRGFDPERDRLVAIKLFRLDLAPDRVHRLVAALQRLTSGALKHPAIAAPLAAGMQENTAYLVQEYVAADSLDVVLRDQGPAPLSDALRVARQLADAIDAGVAHGAIHPRDVLLSPQDARVTGFGIVPALEQVGVSVPFRRPYTAPERLAGASWDRRADIFSIAAVMYEVLVGKRVTGTGEKAVAGLAQLSGLRVRPRAG